MSIFRKDQGVLDIPDLQRKGILKKKEEVSQPTGQNIKIDKSGYIDLSKSNSTPETNSSETVQNPFSFLDNLASSSSISNQASYFNSTSTSSSSVDSSDFQSLKVKLEDLEYKLDRLMEKIAKLEGN